MRTHIITAAVAAVAAFGAMALADPEASADTVNLTTLTVDGVDYPVCALEDCSDQPGQIGVWQNEAGDWWLSLGERSYLVIDDTTAD